MPLNQRARQFPRSAVGRVGPGVAQLGVSRHGRCFVFCCLRFSVAAWRKEAPGGGDLGDFGLDARPRAHPAGQHGPCAEVHKAAGLTLSRLHFGGFAPRARRLSSVVWRPRKKAGFLDLTTAVLLRFSFCLLFLSFHSSPDPLGVFSGVDPRTRTFR